MRLYVLWALVASLQLAEEESRILLRFWKTEIENCWYNINVCFKELLVDCKRMDFRSQEVLPHVYCLIIC